MDQPTITLTIGGSDSGGAAGIQADLKTWSALGVYGTCAITAVTAQNSVDVYSVYYLNSHLVGQQIDAVLNDYGAQGIKTGYLGRAEIVAEVANRLRKYETVPLVVDPVLVNHMGTQMFGPEVTEAYHKHLLPLATLATPNWREAALLAGLELESTPTSEEIELLGQHLANIRPQQWLVTGVPCGDRVIDYWYDGDDWHELPLPWLETKHRHGSGDTLAAAICAFLAEGLPMAEAIENAQQYTAAALAAASGWQLGHGHGPLAHFHNR
ncbi:MAG: bifunctional hydroxymethylpyrimidine kinase/phosphomethylpyrimidine kinase [Candidatus Promineifilaceae bacterium]